ncbi:MAG: chorismate mutase [Alphaproteobacteria bacterium]
MTARSVSLKSLRRVIDDIDDRMHDLLMERTEIVERIAEVKNREAAGAYMRPAREVTILRRLMKRHHGRFPAAVVARIWREMVAATTRLQGTLSVAVHAPEKSVGYWDLARDHYGSGTRMTLHRLANPVIRAVVGGTATVGVLPVPQEGDAAPWWPMLIAAGEHMPRIVARLPFIENSGGRFERLGALAIAHMEREETGNDFTLVAVEANPELSRGSLKEAFVASGLPANDIAAWEDAENPRTRLHLIEIAEFVGEDDARLADVAWAMGDQVVRIIELGGYAVPMGGFGGDDGG